MARPFAIGMWVRFFRDFDINYQMIGLIPKGAIGRIAGWDRDGVWVQLSRYNPNLDEWDNQVQLYDYRPENDPTWAGSWIEPAQPSN
ncbi:MAG: hypothetical protein J0I99_00485 [Devosia sp.]|uniref:hypothetical protein n=1 Tax=Devosia sp. TaxID=1871048 RepID=UPI001ACDF809|nr:hypothetical protein [Devosia sp.]MBN9310840.1 hypothetical protein [Devosia sp.]MBN9314193.1 hypothetical protein [Devosia sp.]